MKLLRYGEPGHERPALLDDRGVMRDLSPLLPDLTPDWLAPERLAILAGIDPSVLPVVTGTPRRSVPVAGVRQFLAIGLNYRQHALEAGLDIPAEPILFTKAVSCLCGPDDGIRLPPDSQALDWEVELGVFIGTVAERVPVDRALDHVAGYSIVNDVSERDWQMRRGGQWCKGKSSATFGPVGPWLVTRDEIPDPQALELSLSVNGTVRQHSNTSDMIFGVAELVSYLSQFMTLLPGDLITTGTPSGVAMGMKPPQYLKRGDQLVLTIDSLGQQHQQVI